MSLFWLEEQQKRAAAPARRESIRAALPLDLSALTCRQCPLDREPLQHPKMPPTGAALPIFYMLGEAPGENEDLHGEQFIGSSGKLIRDRIPSKWTNRIRWNNTLRCRPPNNRDPAVLELACCRRLQEDDIVATHPTVILAFGGYALQWLTRSQASPAAAPGGGRQREEYMLHGGGDFSSAVPAITHWRGRRLPVRVRGHHCWAYPLVHPAAFLYMKNAKSYDQKKMYEPSLRCFERDLERVFSDYERGLPEPYIEEPQHFKENIEILTDYGETGLRHVEQRLGEIAERPDSCIDIETNGLRVHFIPQPQILSVAVGNYDDTFAFGIDHPGAAWSGRARMRAFELLYEFLLRSGRKWAHNLKFEQEWLRFFFDDHILYRTEWGDTMAQAHALDERPGKALEALTLLHLGFNLKHASHVDVARLAEFPLEDVLWYNGYDTKYTDVIRMIQTDTIAEQGVSEAYEKLVRVTPSLVRMQAVGLVRNRPALADLNTSLALEEQTAARAIMADPDVQRFQHVRAKFSPTSNPDLLAFFSDFLQYKISNVDEDVLSRIDHPVAELVLDMRSPRKVGSTYVTPLMDGGKHVALDGRVHPSFGHLFTVTSRLQSEEPNAQNFPRRERKEIRRVIGAPPSHKLVAFDFGQLEARVVAMTSKDKTLIAETWRGDDIHGVWTDKIGAEFMPRKLKEAGGRKRIRDGIKNLWTFPEFFGNVPSAIAYDLSKHFEVEISERDLMPFHEEFWDKYQGVLKWQRELEAFYWEHRYVQTLTGFRRREPMARNHLINQPVQGTASQIVLDAQVRLALMSYEQERPQLQPIMNVHDDLSFYLPLASLEWDIEDIARAMCCCPYKFINVPLAVEVSLGDNWCDKQELHTFRTTDFQ